MTEAVQHDASTSSNVVMLDVSLIGQETAFMAVFSFGTGSEVIGGCAYRTCFGLGKGIFPLRTCFG